MTFTVLLIESQEILRKGLGCALARRQRIDRIVEAADSADAIRAVEERSIDLAIVGPHLERNAVVQLIERLRSLRPALRCIVVVGAAGHAPFDPTLLVSASGLVSERDAWRDLQTAIDAVCEGRRYVSRALQPVLRPTVWQTPSARSGSPGALTPRVLTPRERTVLRLIGSGASNREIASGLGLSVRTVDTHRTRLMRKLGTRKTAGLVRLAIREGLIEA